METEKMTLAWPRRVLTIPPVWVSQSLMVPSLPPDTRNVSPDEKARDATYPERTDTWIPGIVSRMVMSPDLKPTAMRGLMGGDQMELCENMHPAQQRTP